MDTEQLPLWPPPYCRRSTTPLTHFCTLATFSLSPHKKKLLVQIFDSLNNLGQWPPQVLLPSPCNTHPWPHSMLQIGLTFTLSHFQTFTLSHFQTFTLSDLFTFSTYQTFSLSFHQSSNYVGLPALGLIEDQRLALLADTYSYQHFL